MITYSLPAFFYAFTLQRKYFLHSERQVKQDGDDKAFHQLTALVAQTVDVVDLKDKTSEQYGLCFEEPSSKALFTT